MPLHRQCLICKASFTTCPSLGNLVPSCQTCNARNCDRVVRDDENHRVIAKGSRVRGERRNCETCGDSFVAWPKTGRPREGIYCSKACMYARKRWFTNS